MKYLHKVKLSLSVRGKRLNSLTLLLNVFGIILGQFIHNYILCLSSLRKGFPGSSAGKESSCNAGNPGSIPGSGRSAGEGIGYPLQYSGLENSMDCIVHGVAKSWTRLSNFTFLFHRPEGNGGTEHL